MDSEPRARPDSRVADAVEACTEGSSALAGEELEPSLDGAFASDGVDLTVIRWMLERSPEERLEAAQQLIDAAWALRGDGT